MLPLSPASVELLLNTVARILFPPCLQQLANIPSNLHAGYVRGPHCTGCSVVLNALGHHLLYETLSLLPGTSLSVLFNFPGCSQLVSFPDSSSSPAKCWSSFLFLPGCFSTFPPLHVGVPQGSALGTLCTHPLTDFIYGLNAIYTQSPVCASSLHIYISKCPDSPSTSLCGCRISI